MPLHDTRRRPPPLLHRGPVAYGAALLVAAFVTDLVYVRTTLFIWNDASAWLIAAGLVMAALAGLLLVADVATRRVRAIAWPRFALLTLAALLGLANAFVHSRDAWTAVAPEGLVLSAATTLVLLAAGLGGWSLERRGAASDAAAGAASEPRR